MAQNANRGGRSNCRPPTIAAQGRYFWCFTYKNQLFVQGHSFDGSTWTSWSHADGIGGENPDALPFSRNTGLGTRSRHDLGILAGGKPTYNPNYVFSILADHEDTIWAGTWGGGVTRYSNGKWSNFMQKDGLAGDIVYALAQEPDGTYWFGTNQGLSRYDGNNWHTWNIHNGLPANDVYAIAIAPSGDIWIGTRGGVTRMALTKP